MKQRVNRCDVHRWQERIQAPVIGEGQCLFQFVSDLVEPDFNVKGAQAEQGDFKGLFDAEGFQIHAVLFKCLVFISSGHAVELLQGKALGHSIWFEAESYSRPQPKSSQRIYKASLIDHQN